MRKIAINRPFWFFFSHYPKTGNMSLVTCITNLGRINEKLFKLLCPQSQISYVRCENAINRPFFQPLSENWSLVTCITNLGKIHQKKLKLSRQQVNVNADAAELQLIKIKRQAKNIVVNMCVSCRREESRVGEETTWGGRLFQTGLVVA